MPTIALPPTHEPFRVIVADDYAGISELHSVEGRQLAQIASRIASDLSSRLNVVPNVLFLADPFTLDYVIPTRARHQVRVVPRLAGTRRTVTFDE